MIIYTYCSWKSSAKGYIYKNYEPVGKKDIYQAVPDYAKTWFEKRSGWKLVLEKHGTEIWLFVANLENVINIKNRCIEEKRKEEEIAEQFCKSPKKRKNPIEICDVDLFVNFALCGNIHEIDRFTKIALGILSEFNEDSGYQLYRKIVAAYENYRENRQAGLNCTKFKEILKELSEKVSFTTEEKSREPVIKNRIIKKIIKKTAEIQAKEYQINEKMYRRDIKSIIENLPFSMIKRQDKMIYISQDGSLERYGVYSVGIDYNIFEDRYDL